MHNSGSQVARRSLVPKPMPISSANSMRHTNAIQSPRNPIDTRSDPLQVYPVLARLSTGVVKRPFCVIRLVDVSQDLTTGLRERVRQQHAFSGQSRLLTCFRRASSWSMIPAEVVKMILPNERAGNKRVTQFSMASKVMLNRGEITPVLFNRPLSWMTILPPRWSSTISNSPM
jgi:hypothetical protein